MNRAIVAVLAVSTVSLVAVGCSASDDVTPLEQSFVMPGEYGEDLTGAAEPVPDNPQVVKQKSDPQWDRYCYYNLQPDGTGKVSYVKRPREAGESHPEPWILGADWPPESARCPA